VPVIAMTANVFSEDRDRAREAGMSDFVAKPVDPEALFRALRRWTGATASLPQARSGPTAADAILREALARVEGLDLEAGLKSVQGRWNGYERLLRQFADERAGDARSLRACLVARDDKEATRRAHTLKGVAATLGAKAVAGAAGRLERLLAESVGDPAVREAALAELESTLAAFVGALRRSLPERREAGATVDAARAKALVDELAALLATDDVRAARLFEERGAQMRAALGPAAAAVEKRVASFDFEGALDALRLVFPAD
jgi:two-component system sensor histidine kinase/response regulator